MPAAPIVVLIFPFTYWNIWHELLFFEANKDLDIDLGNDSETIFLVTPQIIVHPIDEDSVSFKSNS